MSWRPSLQYGKTLNNQERAMLRRLELMELYGLDDVADDLPPSCDDDDSCSGAVAGAVAVEAAACLRRAFSRWHIQDLCCATRAARLFSLHSTWSGQLAARWAMHARSCARRGAAGGGVARA